MAVNLTDYIAGQKPSTNTVTPTAATGSKTAAGKASLASSMDTFLTLLTAQLKNQDPLSPMETDQFTQQIVQMTGVEQQLLSNDLLQSLVSQSTSASNLNAVGLIGKEVTAMTADANLKNGEAKWTYELDSAAARGTVEIYNAKGALVATKDLKLDAGRHDVAWDGKNLTGAVQDDGVYTLKVKAYTSDDKLMATRSYVTGPATALETNNGETLIRLGGVKVALSAIQSVRDASAT
jgi:flagellar basal-body rod modification protein FlgD